MQTMVVESPVNYLNVRHRVASWLLTRDHKRIGLLYGIVVTFAFMLGGIFGTMIRLELTTPQGDLMAADTYNRMFTMHGIAMVFFVLIPAVPAILGNFVLPLMIGAKDVAFPRLNLLSWYVFVIGFIFTLTAMILGGVDTGWTFYTPYSSQGSESNVLLTGIGVFITGFSSILTGLNFMGRSTACAPRHDVVPPDRSCRGALCHQPRADPRHAVIAITVLMLALERGLHPASSTRGGRRPGAVPAPVLVLLAPGGYIMILPPMGVISEVIACFSRRPCSATLRRVLELAIAALASWYGPPPVRRGHLPYRR